MCKIKFDKIQRISYWKTFSSALPHTFIKTSPILQFDRDKLRDFFSSFPVLFKKLLDICNIDIVINSLSLDLFVCLSVAKLEFRICLISV